MASEYITLKYEYGDDVVVEYNPGVSSIATRNPDTDERFKHAVCPKSIADDDNYLIRLLMSCHPSVHGTDRVSFE